MLKRLDGGESEETLFRRLDEHHDRIQMLLRQLPPQSFGSRKTTVPRFSQEQLQNSVAAWDYKALPDPQSMDEAQVQGLEQQPAGAPRSGVEHILAASALCQLGGDASLNPSLAPSPASWDVTDEQRDKEESLAVEIPPPHSPVALQDEDDRLGQVVSP